MNIDKNLTNILVGINLFFTFVLFLFSEESIQSNVVLVNGKESIDELRDLRKAICSKAFRDIRDNKVSEYFIHPEVIKKIRRTHLHEFDLVGATIHSEMEGRELCRVIARTTDGFKSYDAFITRDGPAVFRATEIIPRKPKYKEVKEYL